MTRPIGYYLHHHGDGHRQRAIQIASQAPDRFVLLGTGLAGRTAGLEVVDLPDDRPDGVTAFDGQDASDSRPDALHYAPVDHENVRQRVARVTGWISTARPALMVVDVSVEIAMLARLSATPTVYVRLNGRRDDAAHLDAFRGACALLCPFAEALDAPETPAWVRSKTLYVPGLTGKPSTCAVQGDVVLVVVGKGGDAGDGVKIAEAARAHPDVRWRIAGPVTDIPEAPSNIALLGWSEDVSAQIAAASVVVGGAGNGLVNAVLAAGRPFICLPEPRPFDEQYTTAARLEAVGAAVVHPAWPAPAQWPGLLAQARQLPLSKRVGLFDPDGPRNAARRLIGLADSATHDRSLLATAPMDEVIS
ncbi:glycosyltransferase [Brevundimonas variabilis]|uniref:Glycosyl transferase family 28 C-terminal domain-containing protein n=1 Tax=Brevundimonas variabilis TaxID=74312 RepID=A0A7W9CKX5_9CAUL|nr:glycosyltransferase [Brevundimonas variabilis]MBB5747600.1 hypothetical protein [Brevundimonas variabilis]